MKYFIYFHWYILSHQTHHISTSIRIYQDSLEFYIYDVGYVKWKIDKVLQENISTSVFFHEKRVYLNADYIISLKDVVALVSIRNFEAEVQILTNSKPIKIQFEILL